MGQEGKGDLMIIKVSNKLLEKYRTNRGDQGWILTVFQKSYKIES